MDRPQNYDRILQELESVLSRFCSGNEVDDRRRWRDLVDSLRAQGFKPENEFYAIRELLDNPPARGAPLPQSPRQLSEDLLALEFGEREEIEKRYRECLEAAKRQFPDVFYK